MTLQQDPFNGNSHVRRVDPPSVPFQPTSTEVHTSSPLRLEDMTPEDWAEHNDPLIEDRLHFVPGLEACGRRERVFVACGTDAGIGDHWRGSRVECEECLANWIPGLRMHWGTRTDQSPLGSLLEDKAEIRRLRSELEREQRARGLEQLAMVRLESEVERLQRLIGEAYAKRGPDSSQVLRSLYGQATRGGRKSGTTTARS